VGFAGPKTDFRALFKAPMPGRFGKYLERKYLHVVSIQVAKIGSISSQRRQKHCKADKIEVVKLPSGCHWRLLLTCSRNHSAWSWSVGGSLYAVGAGRGSYFLAWLSSGKF